MRTHALIIAVVGIVSNSVVVSAKESNPAKSAHLKSDTPTSSLPMGPIFLGSFGLVTAAFGAGFGWQAHQELKDYNERSVDECGDEIYPNATSELADDIKWHTIAADVMLFGGAAMVIGGVVWWVVAEKQKKRSREPARIAATRPNVGVDRLGLTVEF